MVAASLVKQALVSHAQKRLMAMADPGTELCE
jgi:hypothetical protein